MTEDPMDELSRKTIAYTSVFASIATEIAQARQARIRAQLTDDRRIGAQVRTTNAQTKTSDSSRLTTEPLPPLQNFIGRGGVAEDLNKPEGATIADPPTQRVPFAPVPPPTQHPATCEQLLEMHRDAEFFYRQERPNSWVPEYMKFRGLEEMLHDDCPWRVGYAPGGSRVWTALTDDLHGRGWSDEQIVASGLGTKSVRGNVVDRFHDRMVISAKNAEGQTVGFVGRRAPNCTDERSPKYLNSPATEIYDKSQVLLGVSEERESLAAGATPVIVEGALDAFAVTAATNGQYVGLAPSGTALTTAQADVLDRASTADVVVGMDADDAGRRATIRTYDLLEPIVETPRAVIWPAGQDPASMWADGRQGEIATCLEQPKPLVDVVIDAKLSEWEAHWEKYAPSIEGRVNAARDVAPTVANLPVDQIRRQVAHIAKRLDLEHGTVTGVVTDAISERDRPPANRGLDVSRESEMAR